MNSKVSSHAWESFSRIPAPALILGSAGLIPFVLTLLVMLAGSEAWQPWAATVLRSYAVVILSFLGAVHWGAALWETDTKRLWRSLGWGVTPSLLAWIALLLPLAWSWLILLGGFSAQYMMDRYTVQQNRMPLWYAELRRWLTLGVVLILSLALVMTLVAV
jgi:hypothetical protein